MLFTGVKNRLQLLDQIDLPRDLKKISVKDLRLVATELREKIVQVVAQTGGHLASSLGTVELTIALHYVFNAPIDKIIWDVGHQSYAHKILTGRGNAFHTLRQHGGISGFTKKVESPYDPLTTGHSSTSISAGLGMACGKCLKQDRSKVVVVIGDGSMTAGIAYEGMNQAGDSDKDLIVILNDNDMSISPNVGALSSFLSRKFSAKYLQDLRKEIGIFLKSLPKIGDDMYQLAKRSEESFKSFVTPGMLFEAFGFKYFGPIDGHRLSHLIDILQNIKNLREPVLLHVTTTKGKGYPLAEANPVYFHGVGSFEIKTGNSLSRKKKTPTYTQVFGDTMVALAEKDPKVVAVTAAMPEGTGLVNFSRLYPDRFFDVGIAEQHGVTFAAGLALEGFKPVVAIYSTFLQRAYDQILHDVCIDALPVVFAIDRGGIVGEDGPTHHGVFDFSYLSHLPNMVVMAPGDENETRRMLLTALSHNGPISLRYPRGVGEGIPLSREILPIEIGKAKLLIPGNDVLLLAIGRCVNDALAAQKSLKEAGISACVVNARFVKPLDKELLLPLMEKIPRVVTIEEHVRIGGFGSAVLECLADEGKTGIRVERIGLPDVFVEHGAQSVLRKKYGIHPDAISETTKKLLI